MFEGFVLGQSPREQREKELQIKLFQIFVVVVVVNIF